MLPRRQLGRDGPLVPVLGFGAWPIGGGMGAVGEAEAIATLRAALDCGLTLLDTAQAYSGSEALIGRALRDGYRDRVFLATKVSGRYGRTDIEQALDASLRALGVDCIDLYQLHSWNPKYPIEESMAALLDAQRAGKIRHLGVSNFNAAQLAQTLALGRIVSVQNRYNLIDREIEAEVLSFCTRAGLGVLPHSALAKGLLAGKFAPGHIFSPDDERAGFRRFQGAEFAAHLAFVDRLKEFAQAKGCTLVQLALAWLLRRPEVTCVLTGARSPEQVRGQAVAANLAFTPHELAHIDTLLTRLPRTPER